jgi:Phosphodiester glycosidase
MRPRTTSSTLGIGLALFTSALTSAGPAAAGNSAPFHGVTLVEGPSDAMAIVDLCAAGISIRATKYAEREATPETWAQKPGVGADIAVNADFFDFPGWTYVVGRARGAGEDWPATEQNREGRPYWTFGKFVADLQTNGAVAPAAASLVTDIVGGHNFLIVGGKSRGPNFDGDPTITTAHRRTGLGMSADRRFLFVYSSDASIDGNQMVASMLARAAAGGQPGIDVATNQDGGGSSQMYVAGRGQIITSGRLVNNHLGVLAKGAGPAVNCPFAPPDGALDAVACGGVTGWAQSPTAKTGAIDVHLYYGGPAGTPGVTALATNAGRARKDLCAPLGSCNHGFEDLPPLSLFDGKGHAVHAYGINSNAAGTNAELQGSPKAMTCAALPLAGMRRWVKDGATFAAWKFSSLADVMPATDAALAKLPDGVALDAAPVLARADGAPAVYWIDGQTKRHVPDADAAAAWHFDLAKTQIWPAAKLDALREGAALGPRPVLLKGSGPAVYLMDADPATPAGDGGAGMGSGGPGSSGGGGDADGGAAGPGGADAPGDAPSASAGGCTLASSRAISDGASLLLVSPLALLVLRARRRRARW